MITLALLRHGPTEWNRQHRLQGRSDLPLSAEGRAQVAAWRLPAELSSYRWWSSPLQRCRETAELLAQSMVAAPAIAIESRLIEMNFGAWEGSTLEELRRRHGDRMAQGEAQGLDMQPPGGESPRQVQQRLRPWLAELAADGRNNFAVVHKGVIRALYALATGWTMERKSPDRLVFDCLQEFAVGSGGMLAVRSLNVSLTGASKDAGAAA